MIELDLYNLIFDTHKSIKDRKTTVRLEQLKISVIYDSTMFLNSDDEF